ncbi:hypothetical protein Tco_1423341, partial [Tanacetum coccineum]
MIGSLVYLTSSRPDLIDAVCLCARYQAKPTEQHLNAAKWIFRYLKGTINMGLWYSKDADMSLTPYSDADHAGCQDTRRSTSRSAQFLGYKESKSSKKPSSTKETPKGKALTKGFKTGKSASAKEPVEEPIAEVVMDDAGDDIACNDNQPQDASKPKTTKTPNLDWFKQ